MFNSYFNQRKLAVLTMALFIGIMGFSQTPNTKMAAQNLTKNGVAINGYDPVSYFSAQPHKGKSAINHTYLSAIYYFSTAENKAKFMTNPDKYAPTYGGWCAYAMGETGDKVEIDPMTYKIIDGKVYLFYNAFFNNTLKTWNKDEANLKKKADANWAKLPH
jgi:YHS domain-containing protein